MTRFARKGGITEKKEDKKKKEDATDWSDMVGSNSLSSAKNATTKPDENENELGARKRKNEDILNQKLREQDRELLGNNRDDDQEDYDRLSKKSKKSSSSASMSRETLMRMYGDYIDKEVLTDLDEMLASNKLTQEEYADAVVREGRSNRRRLERKNERDSSMVCFNCRQSGHCVENCPEVTRDHKQGTGICYKCGSTEHSVNKCKVRMEAGKYPYATCFICKEQGHLSKQCPDNPRGLYPNGNRRIIIF